MKRIAMISYHTCPLASQEGKESGGMNVYVYELARELALKGCIVDVFTRSQEIDNIPIVEVTPGFRVIHIAAGPQSHVSKKELLPYVDIFTEGIYTFYSTENTKPDVIHAHYYLSGLIGNSVKNHFDTPIPMVLSFHTLSLMKNLVARDEAEKEDSIRVEAELSLCKTADHIIATSPSDKEYLSYLYDVNPSHVSVIPPGVNTDVFHPIDRKEALSRIGIRTDQPMILFVGRIEPLKGIDMLLYAIKIIKKKNPNIPVMLCVAGGDVSQPLPSWSKTLQSLNSIRDVLHLQATVSFVGKKTQEELLYYYNAAEMVVMPSHYESFGMAALEAMSCGVPVITTNAAGISGMIDDTHGKLITSVNNPLLLAEQIEYLLKNPSLRSEIGSKLREDIADVTWSRVADTVLTTYGTIGV